MKKVFIDSSVLFSASQSRNSISALILALCYKKKAEGIVSPYVLAEVKKNTALKLDQNAKQRLNMYLLKANLKLTTPTEEEIDKCAGIIRKKDAHIIAASIKCKADYLITLDTHDFMSEAVKQFVKPIIILTPKEFLKRKSNK